MRFGLRTTILMLLVAAAHPVAADVALARKQVRSVPLTMAASDQLQAPGRVHLSVAPTHVAFSWRGGARTGIEYRTVSSSGEIGAWRRAREAHDMEVGNRHFSGVEVVDRPVAIDWRRVRPRGSWMGPVTFDYLNTLDGERVPVEASAAQSAVAADGPRIVTRAEWGADESIKRTSGSCKRRFYPVQQLFVHHTAGSNFDPNPKATMRAIYWYHTVRRGWCDVGYNFVIGRDGTIFEGRWARKYRPWENHTSENRSGRAVAGAHVANYNSGSVGISLMGNYETSPVPPDVRRALAELLAWEVDRHDLSAFGRHTYRNPETGLSRKLPFIAGHRDAGQTACPGRNVYFSLKEIRRDTKAVIGAGKDNSVLTFSESPVAVDYGQSAILTGVLVDENGVPLANRTITLYERVESQGWREHSTAVSGADGSFSFTVTPSQNSRVQAVYDGDESTWGSESRGVVINVRHVVTLMPDGMTADANGIYHFPSAATSITFVGSTSPVHVGRAVTINVERVNADGTYEVIATGSTTVNGDGSFSWSYLRPDVGVMGTYVAVAAMAKDNRHASGASPPVTFVTE